MLITKYYNIPLYMRGNYLLLTIENNWKVYLATDNGVY